MRRARELSSEPEGRKAPYLIGGRQLPSGSDLGHLTDALGISKVDPFSHRPSAESLCAATLPPSSRALGLEPRVAGAPIFRPGRAFGLAGRLGFLPLGPTLLLTFPCRELACSG